MAHCMPLCGPGAPLFVCGGGGGGIAGPALAHSTNSTSAGSTAIPSHDSPHPHPRLTTPSESECPPPAKEPLSLRWKGLDVRAPSDEPDSSTDRRPAKGPPP